MKWWYWPLGVVAVLLLPLAAVGFVFMVVTERGQRMLSEWWHEGVRL